MCIVCGCVVAGSLFGQNFEGIDRLVLRDWNQITGTGRIPFDFSEGYVFYGVAFYPDTQIL